MIPFVILILFCDVGQTEKEGFKKPDYWYCLCSSDFKKPCGLSLLVHIFLQYEVTAYGIADFSFLRSSGKHNLRINLL